MREHPIDPEQLAALIDGRLAGEEREALLRALDASDEGRSLLAEVTALQEEMATTAEPEVQKPRAPAGRRWLPWALAAAVMLVVVRIGVQRKSITQPLPPDWNGTPWAAVRGTTDAADESARAVRIGARLEDLERAIDPVAFEAVRTDLLALLSGLPGAGPAESLLRLAAPRSTTQAVEAIAGLLPKADLERGRQLEALRLRLANDSSEAAAAAARRLLQSLAVTDDTVSDVTALRVLLDSTLARAAR